LKIEFGSYAYIEFADKEGAENATFLSESTFKGRTIFVIKKSEKSNSI
jgi:hypothetical protein